MSTNSKNTRRDFLKTSTAGVALAGTLALAPHVHAAGGYTLKVGLIGCGGRGTGAASQALRADPNVKLVAMGDVFEDRLEGSLATLKRDESIAAKVDVKLLSGGTNTGSDPCEADTHHGFQGQDAEVVQLVTGWLKALPRP